MRFFHDLYTLFIDFMVFFPDKWISAVLENADFIRGSGFI